MTTISFRNSDEFKAFTSKVCGHLNKTKLNQLRSAIAKELGHHHLSTFYQSLDSQSTKVPSVSNASVSTDLHSPDQGEGISSSYCDLGFSSQQISDIQRMVDPRNLGAVIVSGTVASGKTKTARTLLKNIVDLRSKYSEFYPKSIAVESERLISGPIDHTTHFQIGYDPTGEKFESRLLSASRMAPDCLLLDEIRHEKSGRQFVSFIQAGTQVVSTLHAQHAFSIPSRLKLMGVSNPHDHKLFSGFIHQALVRQVCHHCSLPVNGKKDDEIYKDSLMRLIQATNMNQDYSGVRKRNPDGCKHCSEGTSQLTVVAEVVPITEELMKVHVSQGPAEARRTFIEKGGMTILDHAISKVLSGEVDPVDAERIVGSFHQDFHL